jgi:hypothetical protein
MEKLKIHYEVYWYIGRDQKNPSSLSFETEEAARIHIDNIKETALAYSFYKIVKENLETWKCNMPDF